MAEAKFVVQVEGLEAIKALTAQLEQFNANSPQQVGPLKNELAWFKEVNANNLRMVDELHAELVKLSSRASIAEAASRSKGDQVEALREELAAAEAEIAKRDPLIKAIREGHVYAAFGEWVIPDVAENERASVRIHFNAEDKKCL